ncbi:FkbM family methyltransferase [bacterium]|nr:MAG: FkbM family methyltransferase [bacterium]
MKFLPKKGFDLLVGKLPRKLSLLDIGARGGIQRPWNQVNSLLLSVVLVEPDPIEAARLEDELSASQVVVLPYALWREETTLTLNLNRSPGTSSIYLPNRQFLDQFPEATRFDVLETINISAVTIDNLSSASRIPPIDFAKIDVQGAELAILEGGHNHFAENLVGLEIEVEFAEMYTGQPLFSEVEVFVREQLGLELWDLRKTYWKYQQGMVTKGPIKGRMIFGDALFLRPLSGMEKWLSSMSYIDAKEKLFMLMISSLAYGYVDYATLLLNSPSHKQYLDEATYKILQSTINSLGTGFRPFRNGNYPVYIVLNALAKSFQPTHAGWASIGQGLGSQRRSFFWL